MLKGPVAFGVTRENVNADVFFSFVRDILLPRIAPAQDAAHFRRVILWDNLSVHFDRATLDSVANAGHVIVARPPYSPDMAPIECAFSKIKLFLRKHKDAISEANLSDFIVQAIATITADDAQGWFQHCHYVVPGRQHRPYRSPQWEPLD